MNFPALLLYHAWSLMPEATDETSFKRAVLTFWLLETNVENSEAGKTLLTAARKEK